MKNVPEKMQEFFNNRADIYDTQQIKNIDGGKKCYQEIARYIPLHTQRLLDLGSGTGLELESIFRKFPEVDVTCMDLADKMLEKLSEKYSDYSIHLVNDNYLTADLGKQEFDAAVSIMSFHHFTHAQKLKLYSNIFQCLKPSGVFIECDYIIGSNDSQLEKQYLTEREKLLSCCHLPESLYHYDIPFTIDHERLLLQQAGFQSVKEVWGIGNNIMILGEK
jgi:tRNA (cmo5U34)-methyltransferase